MEEGEEEVVVVGKEEEKIFIQSKRGDMHDVELEDSLEGSGACAEHCFSMFIVP